MDYGLCSTCCSADEGKEVVVDIKTDTPGLSFQVGGGLSKAISEVAPRPGLAPEATSGPEPQSATPTPREEDPVQGLSSVKEQFKGIKEEVPTKQVAEPQQVAEYSGEEAEYSGEEEEAKPAPQEAYTPAEVSKPKTEPKTVSAPPAPPLQETSTAPHKRRWHVHVERRILFPEQDLGLDVDAADRIALKIVGMTAGGMCDAWNEATPEEAIRPGDRIVSVNGVEGSTEKIITEVKRNSPKLDLTLMRPSEIELGIFKDSADEIFGLHINAGNLMVLEVESGAVRRYNANLSQEQEEFRIQANDKIIKVNGAREVPDMIKQLKSCKRLEIRVARP